MYTAKYFKPKSIEQVEKFIKENGFAILMSVHKQRPIATHIPLFFEKRKDKSYLVGHMSKGNQQWKSLVQQETVLAVFSNPHCYVSSSWYGHENVSTWNYIAVHVYGKARLIAGEELFLSLKKLTDKYEANSENPVRIESLPKEIVKTGMRGIVGFEIEIKEIEASFKLSQNRNSKDYQNVIKMLEKSTDAGAKQIAQAMKDWKKKDHRARSKGSSSKE